jgi:hypothetical protein
LQIERSVLRVCAVVPAAAVSSLSNHACNSSPTALETAISWHFQSMALVHIAIGCCRKSFRQGVTTEGRALLSPFSQLVRQSNATDRDLCTIVHHVTAATMGLLLLQISAATCTLDMCAAINCSTCHPQLIFAQQLRYSMP